MRHRIRIKLHRSRAVRCYGRRADETAHPPHWPWPPLPLRRPQMVRELALTPSSHRLSYNSNRPRPARTATASRLQRQLIQTRLAELVVQIAASKPNDGVSCGFRNRNSIPQITKTRTDAAQFDLQQAFASTSRRSARACASTSASSSPHGLRADRGLRRLQRNYSRSILFGYAIPFTHTGVKASYAFSSKVALMVEVVNGWDLLRDNNRSKTLGAQLTLVPVSPLTVLLGWVGGPELEDDNHTKRNVFDVVAILKPTRALTLGVNGDYGTEAGTSVVNPGSDATWKGIAGYATLAVTSRFSLALRGETFRDDDGVRLGTGTKATLSEATFTPTYKFTDHVVLRGEVRYDKASHRFSPAAALATSRPQWART